MAKVRRAAEPPAAGDYVPVWRFKTRTPRTFIILSPQIWGYVTHWVGNGTKPCSSLNAESCKCPYKGFPQRWKGYLKALEMGRGVGFCELTPGTARAILAMLEPQTSLRGKCLKFWRSSDAKGARASVELVPHVERDGETLPADSDPEKLLLKLWNVENRDSSEL